MNKIYLYVFMLTTYLVANSTEADIGINVGMTSTINEESPKFENRTVGATLQYNNYLIMPRFDLEYVNIADTQAKSLLKGSVNGVYEFENSTVLTPYILGGIGYENVQGATEGYFESHPFVHGGGGILYATPTGIKGKVEGKMLQILGGDNENNEASVTAGITLPVAMFTPAPEPIPIPRPMPKPQVQHIIQPQIVYVDQNTCPVKISEPDKDRDGIADNFDQCPDTPCDFTVDGYGCPIKTTLKIHFATNSATIDGSSHIKVSKFANFLLANKGSFVQILGHTDNIGSATKNLSLSERRALSVVKALIAEGVSSARIHGEGRGESMPIASNKTVDGRAMNRRIEAVLSYPEGRK